MCLDVKNMGNVGVNQLQDSQIGSNPFACPNCTDWLAYVYTPQPSSPLSPSFTTNFDNTGIPCKFLRFNYVFDFPQKHGGFEFGVSALLTQAPRIHRANFRLAITIPTSYYVESSLRTHSKVGR